MEQPPSNTNLICRQVTPELIYPLRAKVIRPSKSPEDVSFHGDFEAQTCHYASFMEDRIVSIASIFANPSPQPEHQNIAGHSFQLRSMATEPQLQGHGIGSILLKFILAKLSDKAPVFLWCNARIKALPFYKRSGFSSIGKTFDIAGIGTHKYMYLRLATTKHQH